ncbi:LRP2-binding protein-like isoform X2 [Paramacrobiotus metropolitanus]|uniref:LRP2-binding protein-like isoform X2 n=1 Tax=Paramacrobiotus metropolitanus TaxID=2943436 RepID=UPI0024462284|nr:LRP2-binding protein-like isoform X2 [Paramacrobiotus metropolitanus]
MPHNLLHSADSTPKHLPQDSWRVFKASEEYIQLRRISELLSQERYSETFAFVNRLTQSGSIPAQYCQSVMLQQGIGTMKDERNALQLLEDILRRIPKTVDPCEHNAALYYGQLAGYHLGMALWIGGVKGQDASKAAKWWIKGAECCYNMTDFLHYDEAGHSCPLMNAAGIRCQMMLGRYYARTSQWESSLQWYEEAANKGSPEGAFEAGFLHWCGLGTTVNLPLAVDYLTFAAKHGNICAMGSLAGLCLEEDNEEAAALWAKKVIAYTGTTEATVETALEALISLPRYELGGERLRSSIALAFYVNKQLGKQRARNALE